MATSLLDDAFAHHTWATLRLLDACSGLAREDLEADVPGMFGSILRILQHLVGSDAFYLALLTSPSEPAPETKELGLAELRAVMERNGEGWGEFLAGNPEPHLMIREVDDGDGFERDAPVGVRLAQALHHGSDHRSQVCSALTALGIAPPGIDAWQFGVATGRSTEVLP